ncbi:MAG: restriction endonuclease [Candidatus Gastranaerophilaceae bacterium]
MFLGFLCLIVIVGIIIFVFKSNNTDNCDSSNNTITVNHSVVDSNESTAVEELTALDYDELYAFENMTLKEYLSYQWSLETAVEKLGNEKAVIKTVRTSAQAIDANNDLKAGELSINFYGIKFAYNIGGTINYASFNKFKFLNFTVHAARDTISAISIGDAVFYLANSEIKEFQDFCNRYDHFITNMNYAVLGECESIISNLSKNDDINRAVYNLVSKIDQEIISNETINNIFFTLLAGNNIILYNYLNILSDELEKITDYCNKDQGIVGFANKNLQVFFTFSEILEEKFSVNTDYVLYIVYKLFMNYLTDFYSIQWEKDYGYVFESAKMSIDDFVKKCFIDKIVYYEDHNALTCLSYYYIYHSKENIKTYEKACKNIKAIYNEFLHEKEKESFFNTQQDVTDDNKIMYTLKDIDNMSGVEFENFICELFTRLGYRASTTKASGDQGIDIIVEKNSKVTGVQTKCYSQTVGNSAVQEAVAGKAFYNCDKVMVITNNYFTKSAIELAQKNNVILWNRDVLISRIEETDIYKGI